MAEALFTHLPSAIPGTWQTNAFDDDVEAASFAHADIPPRHDPFPSHPAPGKRKHPSGGEAHFDSKRFSKHITEHGPPQHPAEQLKHFSRQTCIDHQCHCIPMRQELQRRNEQIENLQTVVKDFEENIRAVKGQNDEFFLSWKIQSFHSHKDIKDYRKAEEAYNDIFSKVDISACNESSILRVRCSFAMLLAEQGRLEEAKVISKDVWDRRNALPPETTRQVHGQLCRAYFLLKDFKNVMKLQRDIFEDEAEGEWTLQNGDDFTKTLWEMGDRDYAKDKQLEVWNRREIFHGPKHDLTIKSGLQRINFLEKLVPTVDEIHARSFEAYIESDLRRIWNTRLQPGPSVSAKVYDVGLKLADRYSRNDRLPEAEDVLKQVLAGRQPCLDMQDATYLSANIKLGNVLMRQAKVGKYQESATIFEQVWNLKQMAIQKVDNEAMSNAIDLASAYTALSDWVQAESMYRWIHDRNEKTKRNVGSDDLNTCYNLGRAMFNQGSARYAKANPMLRKVYDNWSHSAPEETSTLECGHMLAIVLHAQVKALDNEDISEVDATLRRRKASEASSMARAVFNKGEDWSKDSLSYLCIGRLYGQLLLLAHDVSEAQTVLGTVFTHVTRTPDEHAVALECGVLYGQSLVAAQNPPTPKETLENARISLETLLNDQGTKCPGEASTIRTLQDLVADMEAELARREKPKVRTTERRRSNGLKLYPLGRRAIIRQ